MIYEGPAAYNNILLHQWALTRYKYPVPGICFVIAIGCECGECTAVYHAILN